jgi:hypothetical protein
VTDKHVARLEEKYVNVEFSVDGVNAKASLPLKSGLSGIPNAVEPFCASRGVKAEDCNVLKRHFVLQWRRTFDDAFADDAFSFVCNKGSVLGARSPPTNLEFVKGVLNWGNWRPIEIEFTVGGAPRRLEIYLPESPDRTVDDACSEAKLTVADCEKLHVFARKEWTNQLDLGIASALCRV